MERHRGKTKELRKLSRRVDRREYERPGGLMLSWNEMVDYMQIVLQTVDGIYAGFQETSQPLRYEGVHLPYPEMQATADSRSPETAKAPAVLTAGAFTISVRIEDASGVVRS